jgi:NADP-dependent 3-hydroxy acid dehydrogenase YdfG
VEERPLSDVDPHPDLRPAVVTGASSEVGQATARALAMLGHPVVLGARRVAECEGAAAAIRADGGEAVAIHLDAADADSVTRFTHAAMETLGAVEILVSNAPHHLPGLLLDTDPERFDAALGANASGTHRVVRALAPAMVERQRGDIVFVTPGLDGWSGPTTGVDPASWWGLEEYVRSLQTELGGTGVRATLVRPGPLHGPGRSVRDRGAGGPSTGRWGPWRAHHSHRSVAAGVAQAIASVISLPRGIHAAVVELQPEMEHPDRVVPGAAPGDDQDGGDSGY